MRCGATGTVAGVAVAAFDVPPAPTLFFATTVNVYVWPLVKPVTV
jgi:hypothetical protein